MLYTYLCRANIYHFAGLLANLPRKWVAIVCDYNQPAPMTSVQHTMCWLHFIKIKPLECGIMSYQYNGNAQCHKLPRSPAVTPSHRLYPHQHLLVIKMRLPRIVNAKWVLKKYVYLHLCVCSRMHRLWSIFDLIVGSRTLLNEQITSAFLNMHEVLNYNHIGWNSSNGHYQPMLTHVCT